MSRVLPILFNTEMVRAILAGRKTTTRRICKDGNDYVVPDMDLYDANSRTYAIHSYADKEHTDRLSLVERNCPICPGDILYVRETWCNVNKKGLEPDFYYYADTFTCEDYDATEWKWRPSIHMPKEAARIWLRVTDVRLERLQDMKLDDFLKEGASLLPEAFNDPENAYMQAQDAFIRIWESTIKGKDQSIYMWGENPWVWVIEFERCEKPESGDLDGKN